MERLEKSFLLRYKGLYREVATNSVFPSHFDDHGEFIMDDIVFQQLEHNGIKFLISKNICGKEGIVTKDYLEKSIMRVMCFRKFRGSRFGFDLLLFKEKRL